MVKAAIKEASSLQRKRHVPDSDRTPKREDVADWIETEIVESDERWQDWTISDIANEYDCSRQHVSNVLDAYFEPERDNRSPLGQLASVGLDADASGEGYQEGYRDGFEAGVRFALEESDLLSELLDE